MLVSDDGVRDSTNLRPGLDPFGQRRLVHRQLRGWVRDMALRMELVPTHHRTALPKRTSGSPTTNAIVSSLRLLHSDTTTTTVCCLYSIPTELVNYDTTLVFVLLLQLSLCQLRCIGGLLGSDSSIDEIFGT